jgi:DNA gyrase subunit A
VAKGTPLINIVQMGANERVTAVIPVRDWKKADYFVMLTELGRIKRIGINEFQNVRASGLIAMKLDQNDQLRSVKMTHGDDQLILVTEQGQAIRFHENDVRTMGRSAAGVWAIRLDNNDKLAAMDICREGGDLLIVTAVGYGKRTPLEEYSCQTRFGKGVRTIARVIDITGPIVEARVVIPDEQITMISADGMVMRTPVEQIAQYGRATRGVRVMGIKKGDRVVSLALLNQQILSLKGKDKASKNGMLSENGHQAHSTSKKVTD